MGALLIAKEGGRFGFILGAFEQLNPSQNSDLFVLDLSFPFFFFFQLQIFQMLIAFWYVLFCVLSVVSHWFMSLSKTCLVIMNCVNCLF